MGTLHACIAGPGGAFLPDAEPWRFVTLRGYSNYRFHDRHLLLASAESRWPIFVHLDGAVFVDAGTVVAHVGDLGFDKTVYGFGLRLHADRSRWRASMWPIPRKAGR